MRPPLPAVPSNNYGTRLLACCGIAVATVVFFAVYDAVEHRPPPETPIFGHGEPSPLERDISQRRVPQLDVAVSSAPAAAVEPNERTEVPSRAVEASVAVKAKAHTAARATKNRRPHVPRLHPDARAAFAQSPDVRYVPFGGF